jgi:hypothetical protein
MAGFFHLDSQEWEATMKKNENSDKKNRRNKSQETQGSIKAAKDRALNDDQKVEDQSNYEYRSNNEDVEDGRDKNYSETGKFSGSTQSQEAGKPENKKTKHVRKGPSTQ